MGLQSPAHQVPVLFQGHCVKEGQVERAIELSKRMPLIMPMRHPYRVEESWRRRNYEGREETEMFDAFDHMLNTLLPHVSCFMPIDAEPLIRRMQELRLNEIAGVRLPYRWDVLVNSKEGTHNIKLDQLTPSDRIKEVRKHRVFTEFYGDADKRQAMLP